MTTTRKPFPEALRELLDERGWSDRELARQTERLKNSTGALSFSTISALRRGAIKPGVRSMELIAKACKVRPEFFAEYRIERKRAKLDWRRHGTAKALRELGE